MITEPLVELTNASVFFGRRPALTNISLKIMAGQSVALLGPNGAGKSTLMRLICGAISPDVGLATINKTASSQARVRPGLIGWLPENAPLIPELTVFEHLALAAKLKGLNKLDSKREIEKLSATLNLSDNLNRLCGTLSLGLRRRSALALALLGSPALVVLDEPSSSLDPDEVERLKKGLAALPKTTAVLISSHILLEVIEMTYLAFFLNQGRLVSSGSWDSLPGGRQRPQQAYFSAMETNL
ncbi:MAG: ABC transporter ATP-binding protein [Deltaproteobacteria bacterium]|jgi:ABC-2 type transport system ATP-binding protein|nr:ABC transporter ATP-binding protein [Deltaproteobacteria bacterium]